jgi:hypothetical protein
MSVKFEKETIKQTGGVAGTGGISTMKGGKHHLAEEIGTALTGGKGNVGAQGYLQVNAQVSAYHKFNSDGKYRPTCYNFRPILSGRRCLRLGRSLHFKSFLRLGSPKTGTPKAITSHQECPRWPYMALSSALLSATSLSASSKRCSLGEPV